MEPDHHYGQQLPSFYLFPILNQQRLHIIFLYAFSLCLAYGSWEYLSRYVYDGHYKKIEARHLVRPGTITSAYEADLSRTLIRSGHWSMHGLAWMKKNLLHSSITSKVLVGQHGWLFLQEEEDRKVIQQSLGIYHYTPFELRSWTLNIRQRNFWAEKYGMEYVLMIAPNKATVYPEYLPPRFHPLDHTRSREQLIRALPEISIIDLTDSLLANKSAGSLYYKTDTHWNAQGAYLGYRALLQALPPPYAAVPMKQQEIQVLETRSRPGDLSRMMLDVGHQEEQIDYLGPIAPRAQLRKEKAESAGKAVNTLVFNQADTSLPKVFFDHDSYLKDFEPLFAEHFSESTFLWGFQDFHADLIRQKNVDLVVDEFVERALIGRTPRNEWPVVQEYWADHFEELKGFAQLKDLSFAELIPNLQKLDFPPDKIPILKITSHPEQTDKLVIDYGDEQAYYWLRAEGDVYYLEYLADRIKNFRVEKNTACRIEVEIRVY